MSSEESTREEKEGDKNGKVEDERQPKITKQASEGGRKQLPSIPDDQTQLTMATKMIDKRTSTPRGNHSYGLFFLEYSVLAEYNLIQKQKIPGVYVIPSAKSPLNWNGVLFVRQGIYQGGIFKFSLFIPENFPDGDCPNVVFHPSVFHPMINSESGELDVKRSFQKWRRNVHHVWQVLLYVRRIFYKIETKNPMDSNAANMYDENIEQFKKQVTNCISCYRSSLYDLTDSNDMHAIRFSSWDQEIHEPVQQRLRSHIT